MDHFDRYVQAAVDGATHSQTRALMEKFDEMIDAVLTERIVGVLRGGDIQLAVQGVTTQRAIRQREP